MTLISDFYDSPIGIIKITATEKGIRSIGKVEVQSESSDNEHTLKAKKQLIEYFAGDRKTFELQLDFADATEFHQRVWSFLLEIPYGMTTTYLSIARQLGDEKAVRAVGMANGRNPIAIVVPCHRVIGSNGSLTGYAYGLDVKRKLLALENPSEFAINGTLF